jgi:Ser/Thr protein kinase RdoA (MazF antagonist)
MQRIIDWCTHRLGPGKLSPLVPDAGGQMSDVYLYVLDGHSAVVKVRSEPLDRVNHCILAQRAAAEDGFPCAKPLIHAEALDARVVISAEEWRAGGEMRRGDDINSARDSAALLANLMSLLQPHSGDGMAPPPPWMHWNPPGGRLWPPDEVVDHKDRTLVPETVREYARRVSSRLRRSDLPRVIGHGDWEAQNIRWKEDTPWSVYDWDSLVYLPEAAIVGAASGAFASPGIPTLAPIQSSAAFIDSYESARAREFTEDEREVAWAASLWPALHNARGEHLFRSNLVASVAVHEQASKRLRLAGA